MTTIKWREGFKFLSGAELALAFANAYLSTRGKIDHRLSPVTDATTAIEGKPSEKYHL